MSTTPNAGGPAARRLRIGANPQNQLTRIGYIIPVIIGIALIVGPLIYVAALTSRRGHITYTTTEGNTTAPPTNLTSTTSAPATTTTTTHPNTSTSHPPTTPTHPTTVTTTTHTTSTVTTTTRTTTPHATTTTNQFATCQACSLNAQLNSCAAQWATCNANTYNCPVLCYGTFQLNGNVPVTCTNGAIPQWPALRDCICHTATYTCGGVCTGCSVTTVTSAPETTSPEAACETCYDAAVAGVCAAEAAVCNANPIGTCALVCAPYYRANLLVFPGCSSNTTAPGWQELATCLCPLCGNNQTCTANEC